MRIRTPLHLKRTVRLSGRNSCIKFYTSFRFCLLLEMLLKNEKEVGVWKEMKIKFINALKME